MAELKLKGWRGQMVVIGDDMMELRSGIKVGTSVLVALPKLWVDMINDKRKVKGYGIGVNYEDESLTIRPYYGD